MKDKMDDWEKEGGTSPLPGASHRRWSDFDFLRPKEAIRPRIYLSLTAFSVVTVLLGWIVLTYGGIVDEMFLPSPTTLLKTGWHLFATGEIFPHIWTSLYVVVVGFILAALLAVPAGILMGSFKFVEALIEPIINFVRYLPVSAMIPLLILWIGIGDVEKIAVIFLGTLFQLTFLIADVSANVPKELLQVAYTLGARKRDVTLRVLIPASLPGIMDNLRITMGWAWTYLIVAELVSAEKGLGYMILQAMRGMQTDVIFVGLFVIGLLGLITDQSFKYLTIWLLPWSEKASV